MGRKGKVDGGMGVGPREVGPKGGPILGFECAAADTHHFGWKDGEIPCQSHFGR